MANIITLQLTFQQSTSVCSCTLASKMFKKTKDDSQERATKSNSMEAIINNPGLQNITEMIFFNLNYDDLKACQFINRSTKQILEDPFFWLRKLILKEEPRQKPFN